MSNPYYTVTGSPATASSLSSAVVRAEYAAIQAAFDLLPPLSGNGGLPAFVNAVGTALEATNIATAQSRLGIIFSNELNGLANLNAVGIIARTGNGTYASRTLTGTANQIAVANGTGNVANPTFSIPTPFNTPGDFGVTGNANITAGLNVAGASVLNVLNVNNVSANGNISGTNLNISGALRGTSAMMSPVNNSLAADVLLNNTAAFFDGPSVAQGNNGTWFASGTVSISGAGDAYQAKLWDGSNILDSSQGLLPAGGQALAVSLSGFIAGPTGNLKISVRDPNSNSGRILNNVSGIGKDSTLTAIRIG